MKIFKGVVLLTCVIIVSGCIPKSFILKEPGWKAIEFRDGLTYDKAWKEVVDVLTTNWDIEFLSKDAGYIRTSWQYGISGAHPRMYSGRITIKFSPERKVLMVKTEAQVLHPCGFMRRRGFDADFTRDVYSVIGGTIGRTVPR
jgi:hypothetical protein